MKKFLFNLTVILFLTTSTLAYGQVWEQSYSRQFESGTIVTEQVYSPSISTTAIPVETIVQQPIVVSNPTTTILSDQLVQPVVQQPIYDQQVIYSGVVQTPVVQPMTNGVVIDTVIYPENVITYGNSVSQTGFVGTTSQPIVLDSTGAIVSQPIYERVVQPATVVQSVPQQTDYIVQSQATAPMSNTITYADGFNPNDVGYIGPGDMRTHLWNDHSNDLRSYGISHAQLMSMPMNVVQKWHNFFHGTEGQPAQR